MTDFTLHSYTFALPDELIAQTPPEKRGTSRLMLLPREKGSGSFSSFDQIAQYIPDNALLVVNNSRVMSARLFGKRKTGGRVETLLLSPLPLIEIQELDANSHNSFGLNALHPYEDAYKYAYFEVLLRSSKRLDIGEFLFFTPSLYGQVCKKGEFGHASLRLFWQGSLEEILEENAFLPLPPYIKREPDKNKTDAASLSRLDALRYQTVYAKEDKTGSVAAPTAGLHFTKEIQESLVQKGVEWAELTLYVGYGTFSPVRTEDIREHQIHAEYVELSRDLAEKVTLAKKSGRPIIAVGTTAARTLEGVWMLQHEQGSTLDAASIMPYQGLVQIFLYPGKTFHVIDGLITNFHLPESSLLMLVSAFAGRERILEAYKAAIQEKFHFFSYGDAMFIHP